ncbi:MAG: cyanoexosortase A [Aphanocapsa sp. GSE-SYN-MK-11-07L]|jgi:cyanoexosortase A|nr:cyanoexosortase A [Aphanocapsa sp. GSE-SYN-MK-11-07L]
MRNAKLLTRPAAVTKKLLKRPDWLLWGVFGLLVSFYFSLMVKASYSYDHISAIALGLSAILYRLWQRRGKLKFYPSPIAWWSGVLLLFWVILKCLVMPEEDTFLRILPAIAAFGFALIASGWRGLRQYWLEGIILLFFLTTTMPGVVSSELVQTSKLTASLTAGLLWSLGFDAYHQGIAVYLPQASVEVLGPCSPTIPIVRLLEMTVFFLAIYPTTWLQRFLLPIAAVAIAIGVNSFRIAILAVVNAARDLPAFDFWHHGTGSNIFSIINVIVFWLFWELLTRLPDWLRPLPEDPQQL